MQPENRPSRLPRALIGSGLPLLAAALAELVGAAGYAPDIVVSASQSARDALLALPPALALLDFAAGSPTGLDMLRDLRGCGAATRVVLLCDADDGDTPIDAVELGVDGLLRRDARLDAVTACIAAVRAGTQWLDPQAMRAAYDRMTKRGPVLPTLLTRRERDVARLVAAGQRNRVIAGALGISEGTVKMHLHNVYAKLGLESRTQLATDARMREIA